LNLDRPDRPDDSAQGRRPAHPRPDPVRFRQINLGIRKILDVTTVEWGVEVTLVEIGADKNTTVASPSPLMSTIEELGSFLAHERAATSSAMPVTASVRIPAPAVNGGVSPAGTSAAGQDGTRSLERQGVTRPRSLSS
jgi:hypothetical protein